MTSTKLKAVSYMVRNVKPVKLHVQTRGPRSARACEMALHIRGNNDDDDNY